jgi:hypothetical protein
MIQLSRHGRKLARSGAQPQLRFAAAAPIDPVRCHLIRVIWISAGLDFQTLLIRTCMQLYRDDDGALLPREHTLKLSAA